MNKNKWFYSFAGVRRGPVSEDAIHQLIADKTITPEHTLLWQEGMQEWTALEQIPAFHSALELVKNQEEAQRNTTAEYHGELTAALAERKKRNHKETIFSRHPNAWLILRTLPPTLVIALFCGAAEFLHGLSAMVIILTVLFLAGWNRDLTSPQRAILGTVALLGLLYSCHVNDNPSLTSQNLFPLTQSSLPEFFISFNSAKFYILLATFCIPCFMAGHFYYYLLYIWRHQRRFSID